MKLKQINQQPQLDLWVKNGGSYNLKVVSEYEFEGGHVTFEQIDLLRHGKEVARLGFWHWSNEQGVVHTHDLLVAKESRGQRLTYLLYYILTVIAKQRGYTSIVSDNGFSSPATPRIWQNIGGVRIGDNYVLDLKTL